MSCPIGPEALSKLKQFIDICIGNPEVLHDPSLNFFTSYIESLGGTVPTSKMSDAPRAKPQPESCGEPLDGSESEPEPELELDLEGCLEPDELDSALWKFDADKVVEEADRDAADEKRAEAARANAEGDRQGAVAALTAGLELAPDSAVLFAKRGQVLLALGKPNNCIRDCGRALELNPDSQLAYKFRGRAHRLLGRFEEAAKDLAQAASIDLDSDCDQWLKEVLPNANRVKNHRLCVERKQKLREERAKREAVKKARQAAAERPAPEMQPGERSEGGEQGAAGNADFLKLLQDPEMMKAFQDPEIAAAFTDISSNPGNFYKYQTNPKIMALITKISGKFSGAGGFPGMGGCFGGLNGSGGGAAPPSSFTQPDDDNLD